MVKQLNVAEAKARLSELLDAAIAGEETIIARAGKPVVRLVPIVDPSPRSLGFLELDVPDELFGPLDDDELEEWMQ